MKKHILTIALAVMMPAMSFAKEEDLTAQETLRKAIAAAGGKGRFNTLKAPTMWMETCTYHGSDEAIPFVAQYASYWPKRWYRQLIEGQFGLGAAGDQVTMFDGEGNGQKLSGAMQEGAFQQTHLAWAQLLYPLMEDEYKLSSIPGVEVDGKQTVGIKSVHSSGSEVLLYFDKQTFLPLKMQAEVMAMELGGQLVKSETIYLDHKSFGGAKLPSKYKLLYDGKLMVEAETTAIKVHATIDPAWFGTEGPARVR